MAEIRVSTTERADALAALGDHHANGRLTAAEYERRRRLAAEARFRPELEVLFEDLPAPHPVLPVHIDPEWPGGRVDTRASRVMDAVGVLSLLVGLPAAIVLTVVAGLWWTFIVVIVVAVVAMVLGVTLMEPEPDPGPVDFDEST